MEDPCEGLVKQAIFGILQSTIVHITSQFFFPN